MEEMEEADEELMVQCQRGSAAAFESLLLRYQPRILRFLEKQIGNPEDARDVTQRTFLQMHGSISRFREGCRFSPWLFTIARRQGIDFLRHAGSRRRVQARLVAEPAADEATDPRKLLSQQEEIEGIWSWIYSALDERSAEILWLRVQEDLDLSAIARVTGLSPSNVKILLHRARKSLLKICSGKASQILKNTPDSFRVSRPNS